MAPDPLRILDLAQTRAGVVIATITSDQLDAPTPCDEWSVTDILNKLVASTRVFTSFGLREAPDPSLDLVHPRHIIGDDPLGAFLEAAVACRTAWRRPGALDGLAPSTIGDAKAKAVLHGRIFDTTVLTWDLSRACAIPHGIDEEQAAYVLRIAEALVPAVRGHDAARYKEPVALREAAGTVERLIATTGRDPAWQPPAT